MFALFQLTIAILNTYALLIVIYCVFSFAYSLNLINPNNQIVYTIGRFLSQLCDPVLNLVRNFIPNLGNIDISPVIIILAINYLIIPYVVPFIFSTLASIIH